MPNYIESFEQINSTKWHVFLMFHELSARHIHDNHIYIYISKCVREFIDTFARHTANLNVHRCSFLPNKHFSNRIFVSQYKIHHVYMFFTSNKSHAFFLKWYSLLFSNMDCFEISIWLLNFENKQLPAFFK